MIQVTFTENLRRHVELDACSVEDGNLASVLEAVFQQYPALKSYIVDEQGQLRQHVLLAIDKELIQGSLNQYLEREGFQRLHIMQALSGG